MRYLDRLKRTSTPKSALLPVLRPHDWSMFTACLSTSLLPYRPGPGVPRIGVGRARGDGFDMLRHEAAEELGMPFSDILNFAVANLVLIETDWEPLHVSEAHGRPTLLGLPDGGSITASHLLNRALMTTAQRAFGGTMLLVGIPSQHQLFVCDGSPAADRSIQDAFQIWVERQFDAAADVDQLTKTIFVMRDGEVRGVYRPPER